VVRRTPIAPSTSNLDGKNKLLIIVFLSSPSVANGLVVVNLTSTFHVVVNVA
jgi:hypothetical protein